MFIMDFDGILLTDEKKIDPGDLSTLARLRAENIINVIPTGRSFFSFQRALDQMGLSPADQDVDYLIFSTGAGIHDLNQDRLILSHAIQSQEVRKIITYFDGLELDYMVHKAIPDTASYLFKSHGSSNPDFFHRIQLYPSLGSPLEEKTDLFDHATQVLAILPEGAARERIEKFQSDLSGFSVIHATSPLDHKSAWVEVFHKNVSKSRAAQWLATRLGICRKKVIPVGNDYNDQDLLEWSGRGFLVDNGPENMNKKFPLVGSNNHGGVSQAARDAGFLV
ncbi:MAG: HAD-IIB family hydrolase [Desulfobacter sp.]|nr:MAG: HAD-IIB family hydrolase [Desulfobacter sp.]